MRGNIRFFLLALLGLMISSPLYAARYTLPQDGSEMVGRIQRHIVEANESFDQIAKAYDVGLLSLMAANPGVDPFLPSEGSVLTIPSLFILPSKHRQGIVINLAELRLYYFDKNGTDVHIFPVGIGRIGRDTPEMYTRVSQKIPNPTWTPPASVRAEYREKGIELPAVVPAGPENPLGDYALRLAYGTGSYLIHGTNKAFGIGLRVSAGCIRMEPEHIEWLFEQVSVREKVRIVNEPIKMTLEPDKVLFMEVHEPLTTSDGTQQPLQMPTTLAWWLSEVGVSDVKAKAAIAVQSGVPIEVAAPLR